MDNYIERILYTKDNHRFKQLEKTTVKFSEKFVGNNIIQENIFAVIENYTSTKSLPLEWIRVPIDDDKLCACTFIRGGRIFVVINNSLPVSKQIFAAAHELYHIRCYLEDNDSELEREGSILDSRTIDIGTTQLEEMEANAFAGLLMAPNASLNQQITIFRIDKSHIQLDDVLTLMNIFAIPYKAMVLRLMEMCIIDSDKAKELLALSADDVEARIKVTGIAKRWSLIPRGNESLGSIDRYILLNEETESVSTRRIESDKAKIRAIKERYGID
ncbi:protein of unknown function [Pseudobutyrivibrio sp. UC1225]|uniref:ImmA/IrrE family metallo-endopeptidase n=1 Tax=Pseudobutyrivibrio sp. UC1225 TaxID=1798185 RepID=UPI0008EB9F83|nr:ImmA/IrrE family metallo-endopeptidase [Pseudobutyrivibrio sp. UC1225]SFO29998.1 protein of unknown function [Pseudobutyrivibrio sp. UC1225]